MDCDHPRPFFHCADCGVVPAQEKVKHIVVDCRFGTFIVVLDFINNWNWGSQVKVILENTPEIITPEVRHFRVGLSGGTTKLKEDLQAILEMARKSTRTLVVVSGHMKSGSDDDVEVFVGYRESKPVCWKMYEVIDALKIIEDRTNLVGIMLSGCSSVLSDTSNAKLLSLMAPTTFLAGYTTDIAFGPSFHEEISW